MQHCNKPILMSSSSSPTSASSPPLQIAIAHEQIKLSIDVPTSPDNSFDQLTGSESMDRVITVNDYVPEPRYDPVTGAQTFPCPHCDKAYTGKHARSIWRRHLQDKHHIPLALQPRKTRWDNVADRPKNDEERRQRTLESKRRWARKNRADKKAKRGPSAGDDLLSPMDDCYSDGSTRESSVCSTMSAASPALAGLEYSLSTRGHRLSAPPHPMQRSLSMPLPSEMTHFNLPMHSPSFIQEASYPLDPALQMSSAPAHTTSFSAPQVFQPPQFVESPGYNAMYSPHLLSPHPEMQTAGVGSYPQILPPQLNLPAPMRSSPNRPYLAPLQVPMPFGMHDNGPHSAPLLSTTQPSSPLAHQMIVSEQMDYFSAAAPAYVSGPVHLHVRASSAAPDLPISAPSPIPIMLPAENELMPPPSTCRTSRASSIVSVASNGQSEAAALELLALKSPERKPSPSSALSQRGSADSSFESSLDFLDNSLDSFKRSRDEYEDDTPDTSLDSFEFRSSSKRFREALESQEDEDSAIENQLKGGFSTPAIDFTNPFPSRQSFVHSSSPPELLTEEDNDVNDSSSFAVMTPRCANKTVHSRLQFLSALPSSSPPPSGAHFALSSPSHPDLSVELGLHDFGGHFQPMGPSLIDKEGLGMSSSPYGAGGKHLSLEQHHLSLYTHH